MLPLFLFFVLAGGFAIGAQPARPVVLRLEQMALNFTWPPVFFSLHSPSGAMLVILAMLMIILSFMVHQWSRDRVASLLFVPYAAWVAFATVLNGSIAALNH